MKNATAMWSTNSTSWYIPPQIESRVSERYLYIHIHRGIIHNSQKVETTQGCLYERRDNWNTAQLHMEHKVCGLSHVRLFVTPWTAACQDPLSMEFSSQDYWSGLPLPTPEDLPDPGIKPKSPALVGGFFTTEPPGKSTWNVACVCVCVCCLCVLVTQSCLTLCDLMDCSLPGSSVHGILLARILEWVVRMSTLKRKGFLSMLYHGWTFHGT